MNTLPKPPLHVVMVTLFPANPDCIDGGVAAVAKYLSEELIRYQGLRLTIIVPQGHWGPVRTENRNGLTIVRIGRQRWTRFLPSRIHHLFLVRREVRRLLRSLVPDIVHFQGYSCLAACPEQPSVLTIHGIAERDALWSTAGFAKYIKYALVRCIECICRKNVHNIIVISPYVTDVLVRQIGHARRWIIENPVADSFFNLHRDPQPYRVFCCSRMSARKNTLGLIDAFARVSAEYPQAVLRIAGSTEAGYLVQCQSLVARLGLESKVAFLGSLSIKGVQAELSSAACFVLASFQETAPVSIEEAMAAGVPVVASRLCGIPYMVADTVSGFCIDPRDKSDVARAIVAVLANPDRARQMGAAAHAAARSRFHASVVAAATLNVYTQVLTNCD